MRGSCYSSPSTERIAFNVQGGHGTGKTGNWMLTFPDRENTGNLLNLIFTQGKLWQHRENCVLLVESLTCNVIVG